MADARVLLRQQRASRRIEHPHAAYTDGSKLLCTLCREPIKAEGLWDSHVAGEKHRRRLLDARAPDGGEAAGAAKRKQSDDGGDDEDAVTRKRSRPAIAVATGRDREGSEVRDSGKEALTPPGLVRRASTTPSHGVELQIPSRPATPSRPSTSRQPSNGTPAPPLPPPLPPQKHDIDESEWAAFEADMAAESAPYANDAVISAPAMTAEQSAATAAAAAAQAKAQADVDLEAEREEATRAMEDEFADMHELEERVRRLKEKREALRQRGSHGAGQGEPARGGRGGY